MHRCIRLPLPGTCQTVMLAAAAFKHHDIGAAAAPLDSQPWDVCRGSASHAMKLLDLENVRRLMLRNLDVCRKDSPPLRGGQASPRVPETDRERHQAPTDPSHVTRLLALDIEELLQHTSRVQRKRRASHVSHAVSHQGDRPALEHQ